MKNVKFNIEGEFVTELAREWFYKERRPYDKVEEFLLNCMVGTDIPKKDLKEYAKDVLKYKRKFIGNTSDSSFSLVKDGELPKDKDIKILVNNFDYFKENGDVPFAKSEYGFIKPDGKYIPVGWCKHTEWADKYLKDNLSKKEYMNLMCATLGSVNNRISGYATDILVNKMHWILINSPQEGRGIIQKSNFITKAQKDTLFDYLIFYSREKEAVRLIRDEETEEI